MSVTAHKVGDVMSRAPVAVGSHASYRQVVELMSESKVSALPVLAGEGRVVGVVSEADLLPKEAFREGGPPAAAQLDEAFKAAAVLVEDLMSSPAVTVHPDAPLAEAARIMARKHVKRLPVVNAEDMLEGVVSRGDLLKVFLRPDEDLLAQIRSEVLASVPPPSDLDATVEEGVVTLEGSLPDRSLVPVLVDAVRAVEGVVDVRTDLG
ncbi:CBS domain-containing protein [Streptomyces sp. NPDC059173]|uniref:CBS domain-containing protein n=1 Tax=unclassified Streptomyces TaxID=2593676 RepID=UPI00367E7236